MRTSLLLIILFFSHAAFSQVLSGFVYESGSDSVLRNINVYNKTTRVNVRSAANGHFTMLAAEKDSLIISGTGYLPDTLVVQSGMFFSDQSVRLERNLVTLKGVKVSNSYSADSLARREYYAQIYKKQAGITGRNTPQSGVGVTLSPVSFFSRESKQKRVLRKRLERAEKDAFIEYSFAPSWVSSITGLTGDSLSLFMYRYRPTYKYCRDHSRQQMFLYVNDKLIEFRKPGR